LKIFLFLETFKNGNFKKINKFFLVDLFEFQKIFFFKYMTHIQQSKNKKQKNTEIEEKNHAQ